MATQDVGKIASYDVHATKGDEVVKVEVKGTTTDGAEVWFATSVSTAAVTNQSPPAENWF